MFTRMKLLIIQPDVVTAMHTLYSVLRKFVVLQICETYID
jgi:hypothetical protein